MKNQIEKVLTDRVYFCGNINEIPKSSKDTRSCVVLLGTGNEIIEDMSKSIRKNFAKSGGEAIKNKYGKEHFSKISKQGWAKRKKLNKKS